MEWLLALVAAGGAVLGARYARDRRRARRADEEELAAVRGLVVEDVTMLGEELQRLAASVWALDEEGRLDHQRALDAYESAQRSVPRIRRADEISTVTDTLSTGRYAVACVRAQLENRPVPSLRVPCFYNPQHGPSVVDVLYTAPGRGTRTVPACARDAARMRNGEPPDVRRVRIGGRSVPYWEAGAAFVPYGQGYFGAGAGVLLGWVLDPPVAGHSGSQGRYEAGGHDFGGFGDGAAWTSAATSSPRRPPR